MCVETMMHLTCTNMPATKLDEALDKVRSLPAAGCTRGPAELESIRLPLSNLPVPQTAPNLASTVLRPLRVQHKPACL